VEDSKKGWSAGGVARVGGKEREEREKKERKGRERKEI